MSSRRKLWSWGGVALSPASAPLKPDGFREPESLRKQEEYADSLSWQHCLLPATLLPYWSSMRYFHVGILLNCLSLHECILLSNMSLSIAAHLVCSLRHGSWLCPSGDSRKTLFN